MASQLKAGRGLTMVVSFIRGDPNSAEDRKKSEEVDIFLLIYIFIKIDSHLIGTKKDIQNKMNSNEIFGSKIELVQIFEFKNRFSTDFWA